MNDGNNEYEMDEIQQVDTNQDNIEKEDNMEEIRVSEINTNVVDMVAVDVNSKQLSEIDNNDGPSMVVVSEKGKRRKNNGEGQIVGMYGKYTKDQLLHELVAKDKMLEIMSKKNDMTIWTENDRSMYNNVYLSNFNLNTSKYMQYYNNNTRKKEFQKTGLEIETIINGIRPPLSHCQVSEVSGQFTGINHSSESIIILKLMYPYHSFSITNMLYDDNHKITGVQLKMESKIFPGRIVDYYYGAPGKTEFNKNFAEDRTRLTYATKFKDTFKCLETTYYRLGSKPELQNFLDVINAYKGQFSDVPDDYRFVFGLIIDQMAYTILDSGFIPDATFTLEQLMKIFPMKKMYDTIFYSLDELEKAGIEQPSYIDHSIFPRDYFTAAPMIRYMTTEVLRQSKIPVQSKSIALRGTDHDVNVIHRLIQDTERKKLPGNTINKMTIDDVKRSAIKTPLTIPPLTRNTSSITNMPPIMTRKTSNQSIVKEGKNTKIDSTDSDTNKHDITKDVRQDK